MNSPRRTTDGSDEVADGATDLVTVGRVAELVGVSVRTLHHWDQIGLVRPTARAVWSDYRLYAAGDVARIQQVLVYRELGFSLNRIAELLDGEMDIAVHLSTQRDLLIQRISRLQEMVSAVDQMMEVGEMNTQLTPEQQAEIFGTDWNPDYAREAEERWGDTEQWAQSQQRTAAMSKEDWQQVKAGGDALNADLAAAKREGVEPGSSQANALAERHREMIGTFYDCTYSMQVCLGQLYVDDERFTATYDDIEPGLATWLREVIRENARANGLDPDTACWE